MKNIGIGLRGILFIIAASWCAFLLLAAPLSLAGEAPPAEDTEERAVVSDERIKTVLSRLRRLEFKKPVTRETFSTSDLSRRSRSRPEEYREAFMAKETFLKKIGLVPEFINLYEMVSTVSPYSISGYYDPESGKIHLSESLSPESVGTVLAHELAHALQDQHFDLGQLMEEYSGEGLNSDAAIAFRALVEGEATSIMLGYMLWEKDVEFTSLPDPVAELKTLWTTLKDMYPNTEYLPDYMKDTFYFPYIYGRGFLREVRLAHPWRYVDGLYKDPPRSTEQIIHPEKFLVERDDPSVVKLADFSTLKSYNWTRKYEDTLGEFSTFLLLKKYTDFATASLASEGWDGDKVLLYESHGEKVHHLFYLSTWDSRRDAEEFFWSYRDLVEKKYLKPEEKETGKDHALSWSTDNGSVLLEIRGNDVLVVETPLSFETIGALQKVVWTFDARERPEVSATPIAPASVMAESYFDKAMKIKRKFEYKGVVPELRVAMEYMKKAISLDEECMPCYLELADLVIRTSGYTPEGARDAESLVEKARQIDPESPEVYRLRAFMNYIQRRYGIAEMEIKKALSYDPENPRYYKILGETYQEKRKWKEAVEAWRRGTECEGSPRVMAALYVNLADFETDGSKQLALYEKAVDLNPSSRNLQGFANALYNNSKYDDAIYSASQALKLEISGWAYLIRGKSSLALGDVEGAARDFQLAAENGSFFHLINFFVRNGRQEDADRWQALVEKDYPVGAGFYVELGNVYYRNKMWDEALTRYQLGLEKNQNRAPLFMNVAFIHDKKGDKGMAEKFYLRAVDAPDVTARTFYQAGMFMLGIRKAKEAYINLKRAVELEENTRYYYDLGHVCSYWLKRPEEAIIYLEKAIELDPGFVEAYFSLGGAHADAKDYVSSRLYWEKYLEMDPDGKMYQTVRDYLNRPPWTTLGKKSE